MESLPTSSQRREMNAEEDDIFSDSFETPEDKTDPDFCPTNTPDMSEQSSDEYSQNTQVWSWIINELSDNYCHLFIEGERGWPYKVH